MTADCEPFKELGDYGRGCSIAGDNAPPNGTSDIDADQTLLKRKRPFRDSRRKLIAFMSACSNRTDSDEHARRHKGPPGCVYAEM